MNFKDRKLLLTVREFDKSGTKYEINGVDLGKAIFFWRLPTEMYDVIPKGSYNVTVEGNTTYLNITDTATFASVERLQICYEFASISSRYDVDFNVDANILKDRYNELVADVKAIFAHVQRMGLVSDGNDVSIVMPELGLGEVWMRTETGYKGFNVSDIEANIRDFWIEFNQKTTEILKEIELAGNKQVDRVEEHGDKKLEEMDLKAVEVDGKLDLIWRMYSVITGSNRYLSGGNLVDRNIDKVERDVNGGNIVGRTPDNNRKVYFGGNIADRAIIVPKTIDLGKYVR